MTPTAKLRFVELERTSGGTIRVLQQWWAIERDGQITPIGEWRNVPLENSDD